MNNVVAFVALIEEVPLNDDDSVLNGNEEMTCEELCIKYDTLFETCSTKVEKIKLARKVIELQKENRSLRLVRMELDEKIGYLEAHVLKINNVMYHEVNIKQLFKLNEANDKVIRLTIGAKKLDKILNFGKLHGDKSRLGL